MVFVHIIIGCNDRSLISVFIKLRLTFCHELMISRILLYLIVLDNEFKQIKIKIRLKGLNSDRTGMLGRSTPDGRHTGS